MENLRRGHLQAATWRHSLNPDPPSVNVLDFGWSKDATATCHLPVPVSGDVKLVPDELLKVIRCGCASEKACKSGHCSCNKSRISCSSFCECEGAIECCNPLTVVVNDPETLDGDVVQQVAYMLFLLL